MTLQLYMAWQLGALIMAVGCGVVYDESMREKILLTSYLFTAVNIVLMIAVVLSKITINW